MKHSLQLFVILLLKQNCLGMLRYKPLAIDNHPCNSEQLKVCINHNFFPWQSVHSTVLYSYTNLLNYLSNFRFARYSILIHVNFFAISIWRVYWMNDLWSRKEARKMAESSAAVSRIFRSTKITPRNGRTIYSHLTSFLSYLSINSNNLS